MGRIPEPQFEGAFLIPVPDSLPFPSLSTVSQISNRRFSPYFDRIQQYVPPKNDPNYHLFAKNVGIYQYIPQKMT
jgi:hypothetical protein